MFLLIRLWSENVISCHSVSENVVIQTVHYFTDDTHHASQL